MRVDAVDVPDAYMKMVRAYVDAPLVHQAS